MRNDYVNQNSQYIETSSGSTPKGIEIPIALLKRRRGCRRVEKVLAENSNYFD